MLTVVAWLVGSVVVAIATVGTTFVLGMRRKWGPVLDAVRRFNQRVANPRMMGTAGGAGASASIIHHVGRTSATAYDTPIGAVPTDDGFFVALPYGKRADWVKNVLAAGTATITHEGQTHQVHDPEIVALATVAAALPAAQRRLLEALGVNQCLLVRTQ